MFKVGLCGHFGGKKKFFDGQTIKTKMLFEELKNELGSEWVQNVDTHNWKINPITLFLKCFILTKNCKNVIILPAQNGVKVFVPLFLLLNKVFHRKLHYVVIGGWLPELLRKNNKLKNKVIKLDGVYVETISMLESLKEIGLQNIRYLPNFKRLDILEEEELVYPNQEPYKLCTFSRVMKEKGIEDAIEAVKVVNNYFGRQVFSLDIYGQIDSNYRNDFNILKSKFPKYISYKGVVNFNDSVKVLKNYLLLLFPTYYEGEGFAGTILDAFAAGIPIVATNWKYNGEIIHNKSDGLLYDYNDSVMLQEILFQIQKNPNIIVNMKKKCLERAKQYLPETVISEFVNYLQMYEKLSE